MTITVIKKPDEIKKYISKTLTFDDIAHLANKSLKNYSPYPEVIFQSGGVLDPKADLNSVSRKFGIRSERVKYFPPANTHILILDFKISPTAVGFFYRDKLATKVDIEVYIARYQENPYVFHFDPGQGYAGFVSNEGGITMIEISSHHSSPENAEKSKLYIDDLSFSKSRIPGFALASQQKWWLVAIVVALLIILAGTGIVMGWAF